MLFWSIQIVSIEWVEQFYWKLITIVPQFLPVHPHSSIGGIQTTWSSKSFAKQGIYTYLICRQHPKYGGMTFDMHTDISRTWMSFTGMDYVCTLGIWVLVSQHPRIIWSMFSGHILNISAAPRPDRAVILFAKQFRIILWSRILGSQDSRDQGSGSLYLGFILLLVLVALVMEGLIFLVNPISQKQLGF